MNDYSPRFDWWKHVRTAPFPVPPRKPMRARFSCTISRSPRPLACFMTPDRERVLPGQMCCDGNPGQQMVQVTCYKVVSVAYNHPIGSIFAAYIPCRHMYCQSGRLYYNPTTYYQNQTSLLTGWYRSLKRTAKPSSHPMFQVLGGWFQGPFLGFRIWSIQQGFPSSLPSIDTSYYTPKV